MLRIPAMPALATDDGGFAAAGGSAPAGWPHVLRLSILIIAALFATILFAAAVVFCFATGMVGSPF